MTQAGGRDKMSLTAAQQEAVKARGNVLVIAGAGTGKTRALVERCLDCLLNERPRVSLEEILVVTFTEAAAAEIRQRVRSRLEQEFAANPSDLHWQEQLALFETAHIGTLHSFCLKLVRQHFYELELDPQVAVLPEEESRLLAEETLDDVLQKCYEGKVDNAEAVQALIQAQGKGSDLAIRSLILRLHHYTQTLPSPAAWFHSQLDMFARPQPDVWADWFRAAVSDWFARGRRLLENQTPDNDVAEQCLAAMAQLPDLARRGDAARVFDAVLAVAKGCPHKKRRLWLKPLRSLVDEAAFLRSLAPSDSNTDPLVDDWNWARAPMHALLELAQDFTSTFSRTKRELGSVDFHDLEQHALRLLRDEESGRPTAVARSWRDRIRFVFVDEYQDINAAQDKILAALGREGEDANRFLVGDIKQSIYRFRLANPRIFQSYAANWRGNAGRTIPLVDNFRSRQGILTFTNAFFERTMRRELGGVEYDDEARLRFGAPENRQAMLDNGDGAPCVELHLHLKGEVQEDAADAESAEGLEEVSELDAAAKEARLVASRLNQLKVEGRRIWDEKRHEFRAVDWSDMAILLRAPSGKAEGFAKEFARAGVPLEVERSGFYSSLEVSDLLNLLQLLDNPLQDVPALAVLRSPLVALSLDELATIRLAALKQPVWSALVRWHQLQPGKGEAAAREGAEQRIRSCVISSDSYRKVSVFLERYGRWRRLVRQASLSQCLQTIIAETQYTTWLGIQPRGEQRRANVERLVVVAQHFDQLQRQGLFRFLRFIEAQQRAEMEPDVAPEGSANAVRLLSIHQSKGLEFPVVVLADLGKPFNQTDLRSEIILDEEFGLCPQMTPPGIRKRYPSIAHWLASKRQKGELLGEELRLLYVAMTRARDLLVLTCSLFRKNYGDIWRPGGEAPDPDQARSSADWLGLALGTIFPSGISAGHAETVRVGSGSDQARLRCFIHDDSALAGAEASPVAVPERPGEEVLMPEDVRSGVRQRLAWKYQFSGATQQPAKTTVSALRRRAAFAEDQSGSLLPAARERTESALAKHRGAKARDRSRGADIGTAHHTFLQLVSLEKATTPDLLKQEALRLRKENLLTTEQAEALDLKALAAFWESPLGRQIQTQREFVHRELPFTFRVSVGELDRLEGKIRSHAQAGPHTTPDPSPDEFVVVQGVADLVVMRPAEIWLLDFKTDRVAFNEEPPAARYAPQLRLYAKALHLIYKRPVTQCWLWFLKAGRGVEVRV